MEVLIMIQIYSPKNEKFDSNGDMTLTPELCEMDAELGGAWYLNITHPIDDEGRWKYIEREAVLSVPTFMGKNQLFRIDKLTDKTDTEISAKAYPIFFDSADDCFLLDTRPTNKNGQEALDIMTAGTKYSGESDISTANTAYFVRRNLMDAIGGDDSPNFIGTWGGEPLYKNYKVILNERAGGDYGAEVRYGKNMIGVNASEDMSEVVTRIVPVAFNGRTLSTNYVDSPSIGNYAKIYTREIKFEDVKYYEDLSDNEDIEDIIVCYSQDELDAALTEKCNEQFEAGIDLFKVTIEVDMVVLENTEEYKDFQDLVRIGLGDTVRCYNTRIGIATEARAIKIKWDCITDSVESVTLGDYQYDFLKEWSSTIEKIENVINKDGNVVAERVQGILDGIKTQIKVQSTAAKPVDGRVFIVEDLDPESPLYGCMIFGTQGIQISKKRTADGRAWDFSTAMTANGIIADAIITGLLSDKSGKNWWNLDTGELNLSGIFSQENSNGVKSVEIRNNRVNFYAWNDDGNYVGSVGATKKNNSSRIALDIWCDAGDLLCIGCKTGENEDGASIISPSIQIDANTQDAETPWIKNTANGTLFPHNPGGGVTVEHGLIKSWSMTTTQDATLSVLTGVLWDSNGVITAAKFADITIKDGLICGWTVRTENY